MMSQSSGGSGSRAPLWFGLVWTAFSSIFLLLGFSSVFKNISYLSWEKVPCVIERFEIKAEAPKTPAYRADVSFRYARDGQEHTGTRLRPDNNGDDSYEALSEPFEKLRLATGRDTLAGAPSECRVNPKNPAEAALFPAALNGWVGGVSGVLMGGAFVLIGVALVRAGMRKDVAAGDFQPGALLGFSFFGIFALAGLGMIGGLVVPAFIQKNAARRWIGTPATVIASRVIVDNSGESTSYKADIFYQYTFAGREYRSNHYGIHGAVGGQRAAVEAHPPGSAFTCYVDPGKPWRAMIERDFGGNVSFMLFPIPFTLVGLGGLVAMWWVPRYMRKEKTVEEQTLVRAPTACRAVPSGGEITLAGGRHRLVTLLFMGLMAAIWNSIVGVFVGLAWSQWRAGHLDKILPIFLIPFVFIGVVLILAVLNRLFQFRAPLYEIRLSPAKPAPGDDMQLTWRQITGKGSIRSLRFELLGCQGHNPADSKDDGESRNAILHRLALATVHQPGNISLQPIIFKMPDVPKVRVWKIRVAAKGAWLPALNDDIEIPGTGSEK